MTTPGGLQQEVAVKVLNPNVSAESQAVQRLVDEARLLSQLKHPVILKVHDLVLLNHRVSLVTEYVEGQDLSQLNKGDDRMPVRALLEVIGRVASALDAAWNTTASDGRGKLELVHRDIKPSNIRISRHGDVKLLDFGIAKSEAVDREAHTATQALIGSVPYMAPERFLSDKVQVESDIWALGCCLFEGLTGQRLFQASAMVMATMSVDPNQMLGFLQKAIGSIPASVPRDVRGLVLDLLQIGWFERPDFAEVARRCDRLCDEVPGPTLRRWCEQREWPDGQSTPGPLEGQVVTETTLAHRFHLKGAGAALEDLHRSAGHKSPAMRDYGGAAVAAAKPSPGPRLASAQPAQRVQSPPPPPAKEPVPSAEERPRRQPSTQAFQRAQKPAPAPTPAPLPETFSVRIPTAEIERRNGMGAWVGAGIGLLAVAVVALGAVLLVAAVAIAIIAIQAPPGEVAVDPKTEAPTVPTAKKETGGASELQGVNGILGTKPKTPAKKELPPVVPPVVVEEPPDTVTPPPATTTPRSTSSRTSRTSSPKTTEPAVVTEPEPPVTSITDPDGDPDAPPDPDYVAEERVVYGRVTVSGGVPIELRGGGKKIFSAGSVPVGRYALYARFLTTWVPVGAVDVTQIGSLEIVCEREKATCQPYSR